MTAQRTVGRSSRIRGQTKRSGTSGFVLNILVDKTKQ
jgi:hypothetical protein